MAKKERAKELFWIGPTNPHTGEPTAWFVGINAADLDSAYINELSDEQYETAIGCGFYDTAKPESKQAAKPSAEKGKEG